MQDIEEIYNNYAQIVYKYIFCLTKNKELSEDIVQETFLVAVKNYIFVTYFLIFSSFNYIVLC